MADQTVQSLAGSITWTFQLVAAGSIARYGTLGDHYYKQYMPGGMVMNLIHPPKEIEKKIYYLALNHAQRQQP